MGGRTGWTIAVVLALASIGSAQDEGHFDASMGYGGVFSKTATSSNGAITLTPTNSGAFLATIRFRFNRRHSIEANYGHTNNSQIYSIPPDTFRVQGGITEYSGAYVINLFQHGRLEPFLFAGAGALRFNPNASYIDGNPSEIGEIQQTSLAFLYGGGADYRFWRIFALRLQYRGLIYKEPSFGVSTLFTGVRGHMAEPSAGIVIKF
jgi:opacity protein-like surface antigen